MTDEEVKGWAKKVHVAASGGLEAIEAELFKMRQAFIDAQWPSRDSFERELLDK